MATLSQIFTIYKKENGEEELKSIGKDTPVQRTLMSRLGWVFDREEEVVIELFGAQ